MGLDYLSRQALIDLIGASWPVRAISSVLRPCIPDIFVWGSSVATLVASSLFVLWDSHLACFPLCVQVEPIFGELRRSLPVASLNSPVPLASKPRDNIRVLLMPSCETHNFARSPLFTSTQSDIIIFFATVVSVRSC